MKQRMNKFGWLRGFILVSMERLLKTPKVEARELERLLDFERYLEI